MDVASSGSFEGSLLPMVCSALRLFGSGCDCVCVLASGKHWSRAPWLDYVAWRVPKPADSWSSRLPRYCFAIFSWGVTMQSQTACRSTEAQAVFVRSSHARRCCAAVAPLSRDLLYVARGKVGSRR